MLSPDPLNIAHEIMWGPLLCNPEVASDLGGVHFVGNALQKFVGWKIKQKNNEMIVTIKNEKKSYKEIRTQTART